MTSNKVCRAGGIQRAAMAMAATMVFLLCAATAAFASGPTGEYAKFVDCPYTVAKQCIYSESTGGQVSVGSSNVPIKSALILQGGTTTSKKVETFIAATNGGETLSKTPEAVEGGLIDLIPKSDLPSFLWPAYEAIFENGLSGVTAVTELALPASEIGISASNLAAEEGVALKLPVKVHLENPFLGSECYIGSSSNPVYLSLTTGTTAPPAPNSPISGTFGELTLNESATILTATGYKLVDNAFSAPAATGCGGLLSFIINPILNGKIGLPSASGKNTAILTGNLKRAYAPAVAESAAG